MEESMKGFLMGFFLYWEVSRGLQYVWNVSSQGA